MFPGSEDGKLGFVLASVSLVVLALGFSMMMVNGGGVMLQRVIVVAFVAGLTGHFVLGGAEFRAKMMAERRKKKE